MKKVYKFFADHTVALLHLLLDPLELFCYLAPHSVFKILSPKTFVCTYCLVESLLLKITRINFFCRKLRLFEINQTRNYECGGAAKFRENLTDVTTRYLIGGHRLEQVDRNLGAAADHGLQFETGEE